VLHIKTELGNRKISEPGQESPDLTNERKIMSTKTLRKRIALVAVSAMGFGLLTSVAANAAVGTNDGEMLAQTTAVTGTFGVIGSPVTTTGSQTITITTAGQVAVGFNAAANAHVNLTGPCLANVTTSTGAVTATGTSINAGGTTVTTAGTTDTYFRINATAVGTCVVKSYAGSAETSVTDKITITIVGATSVGTFSASDSFANLVDATAPVGSSTTYTDDTNQNVKSNGLYGAIDWSINDANAQDMPSTTVVTASATNGALVSFTSGAAANATAASTTGANGTVYIAQPIANAPVSTTVTLSVNGVVWTSKALTITGDITSIKLINYTNGRYASSGTVTGVTLLYGYDAAGNQVNRTVSAVGSLYDSVVSSTTATVATSATTYATGSYTCVGRGTAKMQYYIVNTALTKVLSNVETAKCAGDPYTYTAALDKSSYKPGEIATLTITAKDSKGNLTNGVATLGTTGTYAVTISGAQMTPVTTPTTVDTFTDADGVKIYKFTVGTTEGDYSMIVDLPKWTAQGNGAGDAVTIAYKIASGVTGVTNAEVLAAIVKLIASINKQIAALQKALTKKK